MTVALPGPGLYRAGRHGASGERGDRHRHRHRHGHDPAVRRPAWPGARVGPVQPRQLGPAAGTHARRLRPDRCARQRPARGLPAPRSGLPGPGANDPGSPLRGCALNDVTVADGRHALLEETITDPGTGRIANATLGDYLVPVNADIPDMDVIFVGEPDRFNPIGVKGVGEIGLMGIAAAVANAVFHATGRRVRSLPIAHRAASLTATLPVGDRGLSGPRSAFAAGGSRSGGLMYCAVTGSVASERPASTILAPGHSRRTPGSARRREPPWRSGLPTITAGIAPRED